MRRIFSCLFTSFLAIAISACGFALRGNENLSTNLTSLQLILDQPSSDFSRLLRSSLESSGVSIDLVDSLSSADPESQIPILMVSDEQVVSRPVTVNARARAAQYELRMSIRVALGKQSSYIIEPESLVVQRIYFEDIENISGNREEVEIISAEMQRELVVQLMRRLDAAEI